MRVGDLVRFKPKFVKGALTAVKYYERIRRMVGNNPGIVIHDHGNNVQVAFGEKLVLLNKSHLELVNENSK